MNNYLDMLTYDNFEYIIDILSDDMENNIELLEMKISEYNDLEIIKINKEHHRIKYNKCTLTISKNIFNRVATAKIIFYIYVYCYDTQDNYDIRFNKTEVLINPTYYDIIKKSIQLINSTNNLFIQTHINIDDIIDKIILSKNYFTEDDIKYYYLDISKIWKAIRNKLS
jgi:hypothetical protein